MLCSQGYTGIYCVVQSNLNSWTTTSVSNLSQGCGGAHFFNPRTLELAAGKSLVFQGHPGLYRKLPAIHSFIVRPRLKKFCFFGVDALLLSVEVEVSTLFMNLPRGFS